MERARHLIGESASFFFAILEPGAHVLSLFHLKTANHPAALMLSPRSAL